MRNKKNQFLFLATLLFVVISMSTVRCQTKTTVKSTADTVRIAKVRNAIFENDTVAMEKKLKLKLYKKSAHASYYADRFNGRKTASGARFDNTKLTAAHKKLPFGTKVKVTNELNGASVIVEITDRGPYVKTRDIDLSKRAFMDIVKRNGAGIMTVTIEVIEE